MAIISQREVPSYGRAPALVVVALVIALAVYLLTSGRSADEAQVQAHERTPLAKPGTTPGSSAFFSAELASSALILDEKRTNEKAEAFPAEDQEDPSIDWQPFAPHEVSKISKDFFDRMLSNGVSPEQQEEFVARLLASIESSPMAIEGAREFYRSLPADLVMERDIYRQMLAGSSVGRELVLQEAQHAWSNKNEKLYPEMYETFFNLPGQASPDVFSHALSKVGSSADQRTSVAELNFIGTLENENFADAELYRQSAMEKMRHVAESSDDNMVRALAVQKMYRLTSPSESANVAVQYFSQGPYPELVMETIHSIASGDVEYSPGLKVALSTAMRRPNVSKEEQEAYRDLNRNL